MHRDCFLLILKKSHIQPLYMTPTQTSCTRIRQIPQNYCTVTIDLIFLIHPKCALLMTHHISHLFSIYNKKMEKKNFFPTKLERIISFPSKETFGAMRYINSSYYPRKNSGSLSWAARSGLGCYQSLGSIGKVY